MQIVRVISGGQTGADLGGLFAAHLLGIPTGGMAPHGWKTEIGPQRALLMALGLRESHGDYPVRTRENILAANFTIVIAEHLDRGSLLTVKLCQQLDKPCFVEEPSSPFTINVNEIHSELASNGLHRGDLILNVAGNRESRSPGIGLYTVKMIGTFLRVFNA